MKLDLRYILAKFVSFYGGTFEQALATRERLFWAMYSQIDRLEAERDLREMANARYAGADGKSFDSRVRDLSERIGKPMESAGPQNAKRDPDAGLKLKKLANLRG